MRRDVLQQFLDFDMYFYRTYKNGEIISRMTNDISAARNAVSGNVVMLARNLIMCIGNIIMLFLISFKLTCAVVVTIPIFGIFTVIYSRLSKKFEKIGQQY